MNKEERKEGKRDEEEKEDKGGHANEEEQEERHQEGPKYTLKKPMDIDFLEEAEEETV